MTKKNKLKGKEEEILNLFDSGIYTIKKLAELFNVSSVAMNYFLKKQNRNAKSKNEAARIYSINQNYFDELDDQNKFYILGLLFADGCNLIKNRKVLISLKSEDSFILEQINQLLEHNKPLYNHKPKTFIQNNVEYQSSGHSTLSIISLKISERLYELGIVNNKSLIITYPKYIPQNMHRHFIRGYFDGDGGVYKGISFVGTNNFINNIKMILQNELELVSNTKIIKHCKSNVYYYRITKKHDLSKVFNYLYEDAYLYIPRKRTKFQNLLTK